MITLRLSAAVAPYIDAIKTKRAAGWRWSDIRAALGLEDCSDAAIGQAVRRCRWTAVQRQLPEAEVKSAVKPVVTSGSGVATESTVARKPLPTVKKIGEGSDDERLARLKALGIDVSSMEDKE